MLQKSPKILVLAMSCELPFFKEEERVIREESYGKQILAGDFENVDFWSYSASSDNNSHIDRILHRITVPCDDSLKGTFEKTRKVFETLNASGIEYDYIFRTNCSTYVNVSVLKSFVNGIIEEDKDKIFTGHIYATNTGSAPELYDLYGLGNSLLLSKKWIDVIIEYKNPKEMLQSFCKNPFVTEKSDSVYYIDDNVIGFIVNSYCDRNNLDKYKVWKAFKMTKNEPLHMEEMYKRHICLPVRCYDDKVSREVEYNWLKHLKELQPLNESLNPEKVYKDATADETISFIDFNTNRGVILPRQTADMFLYNKEFFRYDFNKVVDIINLNLNKNSL